MQDYKLLEVILVDDGSTDHSGAICDECAVEDWRVKVIHKSNGGLSDARNVGVTAATGDYVLFLDGDDFWDSSSAVSTLVSRVGQTNADVLNFSYTKWYEDTQVKQPYFHNVAEMPSFDSVTDQLAYLSDNGLYIASACNKMVRRTLLDRLSFERGVYSEDILWCAKLMLSASSMDFICANFYMYRQRSNSIRHTINDKKCTDLVNSILSCIELAELAPNERKNAMLSFAAFQLGTFFLVQAQAENPQTELMQLLSPHTNILRYHSRNRKLMLLDMGCRILGFSRICRLIRTIYHRNKK